MPDRGPEGHLSTAFLLTHRPDAVLARSNPEAIKFLAGALAGGLGKTVTAPFDRLKLIMQVKGGMTSGKLASAAAGGSLIDSFVAIGKQEGLMGYWRGNLAQVVRVLPYSAAQLYSYDVFKGMLAEPGSGRDAPLPVRKRLIAGACAGMFSTIATYPLDSIRLRMAVDPTSKTLAGATRLIIKDGGVPALYRGVGTALLGIAPYMAIELGAFDSLPSAVPSFARGFVAALMATSICYPLDTVRRQIQLASAGTGTLSVVKASLAAEGLQGFYRGFIPNAVKNLPNKGIRLGVYDAIKKAVRRSETAYEEERAKMDQRARGRKPRNK